jgi:hypothetical protein
MNYSLRPLLALAVCLSVGGATALAATSDDTTTTVRTTTALKSVLPKVQDKAGIPIRLPISLTFLTNHKLYATGTGSTNAYDLELAFAPRCGEATACFAASLTGQRGGKLSGGKSVPLDKGIKGRFFKTSCGASCSPSQIQWIQNGVLYVIQLSVGDDEQGKMMALADSAITRRL